MTKKEIEKRLEKQKRHNSILKVDINNRQQEVKSGLITIECLEREVEKSKSIIADLEKQLAELVVEVYRGWIPKDGEKVYHIGVRGSVQSGIWIEGNMVSNWLKTDSPLGIFKTKEQAKQSYERHMAGEELKKIISEENAKQGWKVDWKDDGQVKAYIHSYTHTIKGIDLAYYVRTQTCESELYFSEQSSENQEFLDKIKPLWLRWKGIE